MADLSDSIPSSACVYEQYDPTTLDPTNDSSAIRLAELGWQKTEFSGKSVLDIGANTGLISLHAFRLGASHVHATDVQKPLVDFFSYVVERHKLPIKVEHLSFSELDPKKHAADIVCLLEVLHWLVDQGMTIEDAIARVSALANETLYLETPWDVLEPSIALKGVVTKEHYSFDRILRELLRHFRDVRVVRFMSYFGQMKNSTRILIRASKNKY